jgi:acetyl-CoA acetyltransferase
VAGWRSDALILDAVRSPIGRRNGTLSGIRGDELAAQVLGALVSRQGVDPSEIEDVQLGCVTQIGEQGWNIGRMAPLVAGWPDTVCGTTVDRQCGSSMQGNFNAAAAVWAGQLELVVSAGVEMMSRVPMGSNGGALSQFLERFEIARRSRQVRQSEPAARSSTRTCTSRTGALWRLSTREGSSARSSIQLAETGRRRRPGRGRLAPTAGARAARVRR